MGGRLSSKCFDAQDSKKVSSSGSPSFWWGAATAAYQIEGTTQSVLHPGAQAAISTLLTLGPAVCCTSLS